MARRAAPKLSTRIWRPSSSARRRLEKATSMTITPPAASPSSQRSASSGTGLSTNTRDETLRSGAMLLATSLIGLLISQLHTNTLGLFMEPISQDLGWSRTQISLGITIVSVISIAMAPIIGHLVDNVGARIIALIGSCVYCSGFALLALGASTPLSWVLCWGVVSLGTVCMKPNVWATTVAGRFRTRRGIAMAIAFCGTGVGIAFVPTLTMKLIAVFGWRATFPILGIGSAVILLPLVFFFFRDASDLGRAEAKTKSERAAIPGISIQGGLRSTAYWQITLAALLATLPLGALIVDLVPMLTERGIGRSEAAMLVGCAGLASIVARLCCGALLDRADIRLIGAMTFLLPIVGCLLLLPFDQSLVSAVIVAICVGAGLGAEIDVIAYAIASYFGMRHYGLLFGIAMGTISFGAGVGPLIASMLYDQHQNYQFAIMSCVPALFAGALLLLLLPANAPFRPNRH
ncbi:MFS transporter [Sphingomonas sp. C8-2]|nr:MFS transporter [Sphingomonas sp. C8-2]